jgi:hypothetical protein
MRERKRLTCPVAVSLPAGIDAGNAEHLGGQLPPVFVPGVIAAIAETGLTVFAALLAAVSPPRPCHPTNRARQQPSCQCDGSRADRHGR